MPKVNGPETYPTKQMFEGQHVLINEYDIWFYKEKTVEFTDCEFNETFLYLHRIDGPAHWGSFDAFRDEDEAGLAVVEYSLNGLRHRSDGPALMSKCRDNWQSKQPVCGNERMQQIIQYYEDELSGTIENVEWWWMGKKYTFFEWVRKNGLSEKEEAILRLRFSNSKAA